MQRAYYSATISDFLIATQDQVLGELTKNSAFDVTQTQRDAWLEQIAILQVALSPFQGNIYFEYSIPRMGERIDVLLLIQSVIFVLEFKIGEDTFTTQARDQVWDYALDLKNFDETSHSETIAPILIATKAAKQILTVRSTHHNDKLLLPIETNIEGLETAINAALSFSSGTPVSPQSWEAGRYCPTPSIIEAATALYRGHSVTEISRSDASAINLSRTSETVAQIIEESKRKSLKSLCFVTGVPGAGKTLVGLNIATTHLDNNSDLYSVFLSGNGPLVDVLREALTRDQVRRESESGKKVTKKNISSGVKAFIQNVHHFRDECLKDSERPPIEHVALFDEAQRAWNLEMTRDFMKRKKGKPDFAMSEPQFLLSCLDRHPDWATVVCLVGGGQEINKGEAGIQEWIDSVRNYFPNWRLFISSRLNDSEYAAGTAIEQLKSHEHVEFRDDLHLAVSMRSFRAENVSSMVKHLLDLDIEKACAAYKLLAGKYPICLTRDLSRAKRWLREQARGSERYGIVVSSEAQRLKPEAIDIRSPTDPVHWFLESKEDVRSSYYLEDVATEFQVQGLEVDWACVTWDADFRLANGQWENWEFRGTRWNRIKKEERQVYQKNAYRVLLTRARQGIVIVVPSGNKEDPTRNPKFYDPTFEYLSEIGFSAID